MLPRIGGAILAALAVGLGIYTFISSWQWWITALFAIVALICFVLMLLPSKKETPEREQPRSTTFKGDLDGSTIGEVWSDADTLVDGNARNAKINKITHRTNREKD